MSTDSPLTSTDLPSTSSTAPSTAMASTSNWSQFGNGNNVGEDLMTLRKRCVSNSLEQNQNDNQSPVVDMDTKDNNSNSHHSNAFTNSSDVNRMSDFGNGEELEGSSCSNDINVGITSSTAYSFPGSALGSDGVANLKDKLPDATINANSSNNNSNNSTKTDNSTTNNTTSSNDTNNPTTSSNDDKQEDSMYECNICLDTAKDAVVSMCGHLFCWPCLHQWLETRPNRMLCPVCKAAISKEKVIPLYGRNSAKQEDPRNKVPPRPAGQRTEPEPHAGFQGFGFGDGFHMSFGIGAFPFGYFASSFNFGEPRPGPANRGTAHYEDEQQLSKLFLYLAFLCIAWLLFA